MINNDTFLIKLIYFVTWAALGILNHAIDSKMIVIFLYVEVFNLSLARITKAPRSAADLIPDGYVLASYIILNGV